MNECQLLETIANLILQSITVWEDVHDYALNYSSEYNSFWRLLDERARQSALKCQKGNKKARLLPYSISNIKYFEVIMTAESFGRVRGLHWDEQLRIILADRRFRGIMSQLNDEIRAARDADYSYKERTVLHASGSTATR